MTYCELFNTKLLNFVLNHLLLPNQYYITQFYWEGYTEFILVVCHQQTIILMAGCPLYIISIQKSYPLSIAVNCQSLLFICQPSF